jgi:hypothetical protein
MKINKTLISIFVLLADMFHTCLYLTHIYIVHVLHTTSTHMWGSVRTENSMQEIVEWIICLASQWIGISRFTNIGRFVFKSNIENCRFIYMILIIVSEWLSFNANSVIFQLYHGKNKVIFNEMMMRSALF